MAWRENAKKNAALKAVKHVKNGFIVGLGSGTTISHAFKEIGARIKKKELEIQGIPTSYQAYFLAVKYNIPITTLDENPKVDVALDGADQVDKGLNLIKGMGGALFKEKIVASVSNLTIITVDKTKVTKKLGMNHPVPIEILPFSTSYVKKQIQNLGGKPVLRQAQSKLGPIISDNGNFILDVYFKPIQNPKKLNQRLKSIPGIIETGLFVDIADIIYVGGEKAVHKIKNNREITIPNRFDC